MNLTPVPFSFIKNVSLSWRDALWGYERQLIGWSGIVDFAVDRVSAGSDNPLEIELSGLGKSETQQVGELLRALANRELDKKCETAEKKWLFLVLAWLFERRADVSDPLSEVETIYADFDYPSEIESFVGYMPATDGYDSSKQSIEENNARLFAKWEKYLSEMRQNLGITQ